MAWPPPPTNEIKQSSGSYGQPSDAVELPATAGLDMKHRKRGRNDVDGDDGEASASPQSKRQEQMTALPLAQFGHSLSIMLDGQSVELKDQIQLYTTNELLAHPLVSPAMQPSLGGLPPMLIQVGGSELLKDEQIYIAHKAATPKEYPPNETIMREFDPQRRIIDRFPPTNVQLQVWEDLCHVAPTLSFTRPAKYMYRSIAQFGAWALSHAQHKDIDIQNDDAVSFISSAAGDDGGDDTSSIAESTKKDDGASLNKDDANTTQAKLAAMGAVGKAGDPIPSFKDHMIRQRVTRHGVIFPLAPQSEMASLALDPASIGVAKAGPVRKWLATRAATDQRFANERKKIFKKREKEVKAGYDEIPGENPPPTALVNRRRKGVAPEEKKKGKSMGLAMWSGWGSSHDEHTLQREQKNAEEATRKQSEANGLEGQAEGGSGLLAVPAASKAAKKERRNSTASKLSTQMPWFRDRERPRSPYTPVNDTGQPSQLNGSPAPSTLRSPLTRRVSGTSSTLDLRPVSMAADSPIPVENESRRDQEAPIPTIATISPSSEKIPGSENTYLSPSSSRPHDGVQAYPFKLREQQSNLSTATLDSQPIGGTSTPASVSHSELAGDAPAAVELPSAAESSDQSDVDSTTVSPTTPQTRDGGEQLGRDIVSPLPPAEEATTRPQKQDRTEDAVSPIEPVKDEAQQEAVSPVDAPKTQAPFKIRNPVFDPRTSMLGSIGADGMPNAHHEFPLPVRTTSDPRITPASTKTSENTAPIAAKKEAAKPSQAPKAAPFKMRHTVFDPSATLAKNQTPAEPMPAQHAKPESIPSPSESTSSPSTESDPARSSGSTSDKPPSYDSMPLTNVIMPETVDSKPIVREYKGMEDDRPPTPPPKDDKLSFKGLTKDVKTNLETQRPSGMPPKSKSTTRPPMIGNLSFEEESEKRPALESFVTASEGRELKTS